MRRAPCASPTTTSSVSSPRCPTPGFLATRCSPTRPRTGPLTSPISARGCASATHSSRRRSVPTAIYGYAVIRAVPRVEREEFVNVGVIVSCQSTGLLEAGIELDPARVRALDPHVDLDALRAHLDAIATICQIGRADV